MVDDMKKSDYEQYRILGTIRKCFYCSYSTYYISGSRTVSPDSWAEIDKIILDKVLSDERSAAYASSINEINRNWLNCKECNWYKSKQSILSEARFKI